MGNFIDKHLDFIVAGLIGSVGAVLLSFCIYNDYNPQHSIRLLNPTKKIEYRFPDDCKKMISISPVSSEGDAMITYESTDGRIISKGYNRFGLETTVEGTKSKPEKDSK